MSWSISMSGPAEEIATDVDKEFEKITWLPDEEAACKEMARTVVATTLSYCRGISVKISACGSGYTTDEVASQELTISIQRDHSVQVQPKPEPVLA